MQSFDSKYWWLVDVPRLFSLHIPTVLIAVIEDSTNCSSIWLFTLLIAIDRLYYIVHVLCQPYLFPEYVCLMFNVNYHTYAEGGPENICLLFAHCRYFMWFDILLMRGFFSELYFPFVLQPFGIDCSSLFARLFFHTSPLAFIANLSIEFLLAFIRIMRHFALL